MIKLELSVQESNLISGALTEAIRTGINAGVCMGTDDWTVNARLALSIHEKIQAAHLEYETEPTSD